MYLLTPIAVQENPEEAETAGIVVMPYTPEEDPRFEIDEHFYAMFRDDFPYPDELEEVGRLEDGTRIGEGEHFRYIIDEEGTCLSPFFHDIGLVDDEPGLYTARLNRKEYRIRRLSGEERERIGEKLERIQDMLEASEEE